MGPDSGVLSASHTDLVELFTQGQIIQGGKMEESHSLTTRYDFSMAVSFFFPPPFNHALILKTRHLKL